MTQNAPTTSVLAPSTLKDVKDQLPTLKQSIILEEGRAPRQSQMGILAVMAMLSAFIGWAVITPMSQITVTGGQIVPVGHVKVVQHLEGGVITEFHVKEGDVVKEGDTLLKLDPKSSLTELETLRTREKTLQIYTERLRSFGLNQQPDFSKFGEEMKSIVDDQKSMFEMQIKNREEQRTVLMKQLEQARAQLAIQLGQEHDLREQLEVVEQQRNVNRQLHERKLLTGSDYRNSEENLAKVRKELHSIINQSQDTRHLISDQENKIIELETNLRNAALEKMGEVGNEMAQLNEQIVKLKDRVDRQTVRAPFTGIIKDIKMNTVGAAVPPGGEILTIVPVEDVEARVHIKPQDVGLVQPGQKVMVKFSAYDYTRYGGIRGELKTISGTTFMDEEKKPYYEGVILLDKAHVGDTPGANLVIPGMTVTAEIETGRKTLAEYLVSPFSKVLHRAS